MWAKSQNVKAGFNLGASINSATVILWDLSLLGQLEALSAVIFIEEFHIEYDSFDFFKIHEFAF